MQGDGAEKPFDDGEEDDEEASDGSWAGARIRQENPDRGGAGRRGREPALRIRRDGAVSAVMEGAAVASGLIRPVSTPGRDPEGPPR